MGGPSSGSACRFVIPKASAHPYPSKPLSTARRDEGLKLREYEAEGVRYYILIYPNAQLAKIYRHDGNKFRKVAECDTDRFEFDGLPCPVSVDFGLVFRRLR